MAKVTIKGIPEARNNALKFLQNTVKDKQFLDGLGQETTNQIRNRTRARLEEYKQDPITKGSVKRRESLIRSGNSFDPQIVTAKKSNLSLSGQLLGAMKYRVNQGINVISVFIDSARKPYRGVKGQDLERKTNTQIKKELEDRGRKFFFISEKLNTLLTSKIAQQLRRKLALYNKIIRKLS